MATAAAMHHLLPSSLRGGGAGSSSNSNSVGNNNNSNTGSDNNHKPSTSASNLNPSSLYQQSHSQSQSQSQLLQHQHQLQSQPTLQPQHHYQHQLQLSRQYSHPAQLQHQTSFQDHQQSHPTLNPHSASHSNLQTPSPAPSPAPNQSSNHQQLQHHGQFIVGWREDSKVDLTEVAAETTFGHTNKLCPTDFQLLKTLGTGTFARVWLTRLAKPKTGDENKVFALKVLRKVDVIRLKQVEHVRNERNVLAEVAGHPFITNMVASFQDHDSLYMLLDYCPGGEVFSYLRRARRFNEPTSQFYAAEIVLVLEFLHEKQGVAYRDLKPENILIDAEGHLKLVDFGFAKRIEDRETYTLCGTPEYLAPEVIRNTGHGRAVDWWAFGILVYEFLVGQPPFWDQNPMKIYEQIVEGKLRFPAAMSRDARDIISGLCTIDVSKRLGNISGGAGTVKAHPWFRRIDWDALYHRRIRGPIIPHLRGPADTRNFDEYEPEPKERAPYTEELRNKYEESFKDF